MSFKDKHIKQAFGPLMVSVLMLVPSGCVYQPKTGEQNNREQGLLDPTPILTEDRYGAPITIYHVNVPTYDQYGNRKADQAVLTRGLKDSDYKGDTSKLYLKKAYINDSQMPCYINVDKNNAVLTDDGFKGLFLDNNDRVVVVRDDNVSKFLAEHSSVYSYKSAKKDNLITVPVSEGKKQPDKNDKTDSIAEIFGDSLRTDTLSLAADTTDKATVVLSDTVLYRQQNTHE